MEGQTLFNVGLFYEHNKQHELMKKYYRHAINLNNTNAMIKLGNYYNTIEKNNTLMIHYLMNAIELNDTNAMILLARYYYIINSILADKYYIMAFELGNIYALKSLIWYYRIYKNNNKLKKYLLIAVNLDNDFTNDAIIYMADYYDLIEPNEELMMYYYMKRIEVNDINAMIKLAHFYKRQQKYDLMKKYFMMAVKLNDICSMLNLASYYYEIENNYDLMKKYYLMSIEYGSISGYKYLLEYFISHENFKWIYYLLYTINNSSFNYYRNHWNAFYNLKPFIEYRTKILNNVSNLIKLLYKKKINRFIFKHSRNYLYNPVNGRLFIKRIVNKYT